MRRRIAAVAVIEVAVIALLDALARTVTACGTFEHAERIAAIAVVDVAVVAGFAVVAPSIATHRRWHGRAPAPACAAAHLAAFATR